MKDLREMTDYERDAQFPPSRIWGAMLRGSVYFGLGAFLLICGWLTFRAAIILALAVRHSF